MEALLPFIFVSVAVVLALALRLSGRKRGGPTRRVGFVDTDAASRPPYPGDYKGPITVEYSPQTDGDPDPGEVVWTWVPFEEDHKKGKDRPVLIIGRDGPWLLGLQLTSKDHDRDAAKESRWGRRWMDIGPGSWDPKGRPSEVRLDRIIRVNPRTVRREGATLDKGRFLKVTGSL